MNAQTHKEKIYTIIFGTTTPAGRYFDITLIVCILISMLVLMLDSVQSLATEYHYFLRIAEWFFTILFTVEYLLRIYCSPKPWRYVTSFYGFIDLISVLPSYLSLIFSGANYLLMIRLFRVLRVFRVFKLFRYLSEANVLMRSLGMARRKIMVFFVSVLVLSTVFGSLMYIVEGGQNGFSSIPKSIYWTIVTITTVGYGDITPHTVLGQFIAALAMLTGYSIIAIPTGILTAELSQEIQRERNNKACGICDRYGHDVDAHFCKYCGGKIP